MKKLIMALSLLVSACCSAEAINTFPEDVINFLDEAETCQHLAEERDGDLTVESREEIEKATDYYCGRAKQQKTALGKKYKGNADIVKQLDNYKF